MPLIFPIFIFIFGLIVGSFLNCLIFRLEKKESFIFGRSFCPKCHHQLSFQDLIPVFSFLILRGKCRYCSQKISWQYPLVELLTAFLFFLIFQFQVSNFNYFSISIFLNLIYYWLIASFLIIIFIYDLRTYIIPDKIIFFALLGIIFYRLFEIWNYGKWNTFLIWNLGFGILPSFFLLAIILLSHGHWMGLGDFKLSILMGLFLGYPNILVALFFSFFLGGIIGLGLVLLKKKSLKSEIPFGPFLVSGTFFSLFFGQKIVDFYLNLFYNV